MRTPMEPDQALRALLIACKGGGSDASFEAALDAVENLENSLTRLDRRMPDGMGVVARLVSEGYCSTIPAFRG